MSVTGPSLTERERNALERFRPLVTDGRVLTDLAQDRLARDADEALIADYAVRLTAVASDREDAHD